MSDSMKPPPPGLTPDTHCTWCGAEYTDATQAPRQAPATPRPPKPTGTEPATHCAWCGAEYPLPKSDS